MAEDGFTPPDDAEDLGNGHLLAYSGWSPDRGLNPHVAHLPDVDKWGAVVYHRRPSGQPCAGFVTFAGEVQREVAPRAVVWTVESWEPLTISPSVLCVACGDHGFIQEGRWISA